MKLLALGVRLPMGLSITRAYEQHWYCEVPEIGTVKAAVAAPMLAAFLEIWCDFVGRGPFLSRGA